MTVTTRVTGSTVEILVDGRFDYNLHQAFRDAYENKSADSEFVVDLGGTEYMDSSALGMLLVLREFAGGSDGNVSLVNCGTELRSLLAIANYDDLFSINDAQA